MRCTRVRRHLGIIDFAHYEQTTLPSPIREHLEQCPACREWLRETRRVSDLVRGRVSPAALGTDFTTRVMHRVGSSSAPRGVSWSDRLFGSHRPTAPVFPPGMLLAVLSVLIIVIAIGVLLSGPPQPDGSLSPAPAQGVVAAGTGPTGNHPPAPTDARLTPIRHDGR